ncbi:hypothetical protein ACFWY6_01080 [Streptomyces sp. NPDC059037]|uniref:hypothetical protein n=1 Tax=Streptomyces sp. NPDC059037 TaxID=3346710 RepID=UPI0036B387A9
MDSESWTAITGIAGIAGTALAPIVVERMRRKSVRLEQLTGQRLAVYADLLRVTARIVDNADFWSSVPVADLEQADPNELDRVMSQVQVVASKDVQEAVKGFSSTVHEFNRKLDLIVRPYHEKLVGGEAVDSELAIRQRMDLGTLADAIRSGYKEVEKKVRSDLK